MVPWLPLVLGVGALVALPACGGRARGLAEAPDSSSAGAANSATGGSRSAGEPSFFDDPFIIGRDPKTEEVFIQLPTWPTTTAEQNSERPLTNLCDQSWTAEDVLAAIGAADVTLSQVNVIEAAQLPAKVDELRNDRSPPPPRNPLWAALFKMDTNQIGVVYLQKIDGNGLYFRYVLVEPDCRIRFVGSYVEHVGTGDCGTYNGFPVWGVPATSPATQRCVGANGLYVLSAVVDEDPCERTGAALSCVFSYQQTALNTANVYFIDFPLPELDGPTLTLYIEDGRAQTRVENSLCGTGTTSVAFQKASELSIEAVREGCENDPVDQCRWVMSSNLIYGPLR